MDEADVLAAAVAVQPYLGELAGAEAEEIERELSALLARGAAGESVKVGLLTLLSRNAATREWIRRALAVPREYRAFQPQGGTAEVPGLRYVCPGCGLEWYRFSVLDPVPVCATDEIRYERAP